MNKSEFEELNKLHLAQVPNKDIVNNSKIFITFSGVPGSGKSYWSQQIATRYKAVLLDNNLVRNIIRELYNTENIEIIQGKLLEYVKLYFDQVFKWNNRFIVLDSNIDHKYDEVKEYCTHYNFKLVVIGIDVDKELAEKRIIAREGDKAKNYIKYLEHWFNKNNEFRSKHNVDFTINMNTKETELWHLLDNLVLAK